MSTDLSFTHCIIAIRSENLENIGELQAIRAVNVAAFGEIGEADLVDKLRADGHVLISLVAELESTIVGHVLFSRIWIHTASGGSIGAVALAPCAVLPDHQRKRIGHVLIANGLDRLRVRGERIVIVVGHPDYYPRFGFSTEKAALLETPFPRNAFMAMELVNGALRGVQGRVTYPPAFGI